MLDSPAPPVPKKRAVGILLLVISSLCVLLLSKAHGFFASVDFGWARGATGGSQQRQYQREDFSKRTSLGPRPPANERERRWAELPEYDPEEHLLYFVHILKTSGTSFSFVLHDIFGEKDVVPTSHASGYLDVKKLQGHNATWWAPYKVMYGHNGCGIIDALEIPPSKKMKLLLVVRNPLLHKASVYSETICRFGRHIHDGVIDMEEATLARIDETPGRSAAQYTFCRDPELWVESSNFANSWRDIESRTYAYEGGEAHRCIRHRSWVSESAVGKGETPRGKEGCNSLKAMGHHTAILEEYYDRLADSAIRRMEDALWVGVTERSDEADCLLFLMLGKGSTDMGSSRHKEPRPITVWSQDAMSKATRYDQADWKLFNAANDMLDLRIWTARERLKNAGPEEREILGTHCVNVLNGLGVQNSSDSGGVNP